MSEAPTRQCGRDNDTSSWCAWPAARLADRTVEQAFTVRVVGREQGESGGSGAPRVTLTLDSSLTVAWDEPENPGPPITGYDVQYRERTSGVFIHAPHAGTGRTATLRGLEAATLHQVQVRARNAKVRARWSEPGEGWTLAARRRAAVFRPRRGGTSLISQSTAPELRVGYGQVETDDRMAPPAGLAIFSSRINGILVSEAGVPAVSPVLEDGSSPRPTRSSGPASPWPIPTTRPPRSRSSSPTCRHRLRTRHLHAWSPGTDRTIPGRGSL